MSDRLLIFKAYVYVCVFLLQIRIMIDFAYKKSLYKLITFRTNKLPQNYYTTEHMLSISRVFRNTDIWKGASINAPNDTHKGMHQIKSD